MKRIIPFACILLAQSLFSQVGINTDYPKGSLDVSAKFTDGSRPEGLVAPRLSGDQIKAGDAQYTSDHKGNIIYATSPVGIPSLKTINITAEGYYFFDGNAWQKIITTDVSIYKNDGALASNRTVTMGSNTLAFTSTATAGTSHFQVDGSTLNVDAVNNNVGIGTTTPARKLDINGGNTPGAVKIVDGTQAEGRFLVSDANGVGTWRESTGSAVVIDSSVGPISTISNAGIMSYTGASAVVKTPGYYIISPRIILDRDAVGCSSFVAYNLSQTNTVPVTNPAFDLQDVHMPPGPGLYDFIYTSNIAYLNAATYYLMVRYSGGCGTVKTRSTSAENSFTLTLLK